MDSHTFIGRVKKPWYKKINPIWYFLNDDEQKVIDAAWYHPEWPQWWRWFYWNLFRNPLQNFRCYVIGVADRNYTVVGRSPVLTVQRNDVGQYGWQWCVLKLKLPMPFISYCVKRIIWYAGWQPTGIFGLKLNLTRPKQGS